MMKPAAKPKMRKCRNRACGDRFVPARQMQVACSVGCAIILSKQKIQADAEKKAKAERAQDKEKLLQLQKLEYFHKLTEKAFNAFIRARDADKPCISCGRTNADKWDAGHYIAVGANRTLRYDEDNVHKQCSRPCNKDKGGNAIEYRKGLVERIGIERVERLEGWHEPRKWTREELQAKAAHYRAKTKELKDGNSAP